MQNQGWPTPNIQYLLSFQIKLGLQKNKLIKYRQKRDKINGMLVIDIKRLIDGSQFN